MGLIRLSLPPLNDNAEVLLRNIGEEDIPYLRRLGPEGARELRGLKLPMERPNSRMVAALLNKQFSDIEGCLRDFNRRGFSYWENVAHSLKAGRFGSDYSLFLYLAQVQKEFSEVVVFGRSDLHKIQRARALLQALASAST